MTGWFRKSGWPLCALLVLCVIPATFAATKNRVPVFACGLGYWALVALCWRPRWSRVFSVPLVFAWCANALVSFLFHYEYAGGLTVANAQNMLLTNAAEARGMMASHWEWLAGGLVLFSAMLWLLHQVSGRNAIAPKFQRRGAVALGIYLLIIPLIYTLNGRGKRVGFLMSETILVRTPLYNAPQFIRAAGAIKAARSIRDQKISYHLKTIETGVDVHVIVIGESARRGNLGLYGYPRDTTPRVNAERKQMLLFNRAIAPAPMTFMAVALSLCKPERGPGMPRNIADNIINVAVQAGMRTLWLDRDPRTPGNLVDHIAGFANRAVFQIGRYDEDMLPLLEQALAGGGGKKLIIMHIAGSHSPYGPSQYPPETARFSDGEDADLNNYDNSIYATDAFLGKIFALLGGRKASLLYYSDHALARKTTFGRSRFRHGSIRFPREAVDIPMFIWFSPVVSNPRKIGMVDAPYSTGDNYYLVGDWLGVEFAEGAESGQSVSSPLREDYIPRKEIMILGTDQKPRPYSQLPGEEKGGG
jgi:glucan phosphoethanolaminetransferase (alkaline phosphatase superfamily)